ncbi:unnamed protein product, partial [Symbiodinium necroappetens]
ALPNYFEAVVLAGKSDFQFANQVLPATVESELDSPSKLATIHAEPDPKLEVQKELKEELPTLLEAENMPDDTAFGLQNKGCKAKLVDRLVEQEALQKKVSAKYPEQRFEVVLSECKKAQIGVERKRTLEAKDFFGYWGVA